MEIQILRKIDRWCIVTDGHRFGFGNVVDGKVDDVDWYETRYEAETAMLDHLERLYADEEFSPSEPLLGTTEAAALISKITGENWDRRYVAQYRRIDPNFPKPDLRIGRRPYWFQSSIEKYAYSRRKTK